MYMYILLKICSNDLIVKLYEKSSLYRFMETFFISLSLNFDCIYLWAIKHYFERKITQELINLSVVLNSSEKKSLALC